MACENCGTEHDSSYGSGRFCSAKCARGFSTKNKRAEISEKVSQSLTGRKGHSGFTFNQTEEAKQKIAAGHWKRNVKLLMEGKVGKTFAKRWLKETRGDNCEECGITEWRGKKLEMHVHHVDGDKKNNLPENLQLLCPNCHYITDNWGNKKR